MHRQLHGGADATERNPEGEGGRIGLRLAVVGVGVRVASGLGDPGMTIAALLCFENGSLELMRTLIFCTAFAETLSSWDERYRLWLEAIDKSKLRYDQILIVDDGSPVLPEWPGVAIVKASWDLRCTNRRLIWHFGERLGRPSALDYPGWHRSFTFAARYALANGFDKVVHLEADAFLVSERVQEYVNQFDNGWAAFWCSRHRMPESAIQIIAASGLGRFVDFSARPYSDFVGRPIEPELPLTLVEKRFTGDRYGEFQRHVPRYADWATQCSGSAGPIYFWWLDGPGASLDRAKLRSRFVKQIAPPHNGVPYLEMISHIDRWLSPRAYFEIGTESGQSVRAVSCDAVCVDPNFLLSADVVGRRRRTLLHQMTSDEFFEQYDLKELFPEGPDLVFLDGLHLYEALLRDFINVELSSRPETVVLIHDCLPLNARMAERTFVVDESEGQTTRDWWTGDVWKIIPILKKYRPDLDILYFDCPPTGLVVCLGLNPRSTVLAERYNDICQEAELMSLSEFGIAQVWSLYPTIDTARLVADPANLPFILQKTDSHR